MTNYEYDTVTNITNIIHDSNVCYFQDLMNFLLDRQSKTDRAEALEELMKHADFYNILITENRIISGKEQEA